MKARLCLSIILLINCSILFGQNWVRYSDSILSNIRSGNHSKAKDFLDLAEKDLLKDNFKRDTLYADFLYRKGLISYFQKQNPAKEFNESLSIWKDSKNVSRKKLMRLYFYFGSYYDHVEKDYKKAYDFYSLCYEVGKQIDFDSINDFKNVTYRLYLIDRFENNNNEDAAKWANVYIDLKDNQAVDDLDFSFATAIGFTKGSEEEVMLLQRYLKSYHGRNIDDHAVLLGINLRLMNAHYSLGRYIESIKYGEESLEIIKSSGLDENEELIYTVLISAYHEINDNINEDKYQKARRDKFPREDGDDYYEELEWLIKSEDYKAFELKFKIYEERLKKERNYDDLLSIYALSVTLFERSLLYDKTTIESQISFLESQREHLSEENNIIFDLLVAEYSFFTQDFLRALNLCNKNLNASEDQFKLILLKLKAISEQMLGMPNAQETAYNTVAFSRELYGNNNPQILPYLILPLYVNVYGTDNRSTAIATEALQLIYTHNLEQTEIAAQIWNLLGNEAFLKNNQKDAERYYKKAYNIFIKTEQVTNPNLYYSSLLGLANSSLLQTNYADCWHYLEKAREFIESQNNLMSLAQGDYYDVLGHYYFYQDDFVNAKMAYKRSFSMYGAELSKGRQIHYILSDYFIEKNIEKTIEELEDFYITNGSITKVLKIIYLLKYNNGQDEEARSLLLNSIHDVISKNNAYFHLLSDAEREALYMDFTDQFEFLNTHLLLTNDQTFLEEYLNFRFYFKSLLLSNTKQGGIQNGLEIANYKQLKENTILLNNYFEQSDNFSSEIEELQHENRELERFLSMSSSTIESPTLESVTKQLKDNEAYVEIIRINKQSRSATKDKINIVNKFTDSIYYGAFIVKNHGSPKFLLIDSTASLEKNFLKTYQNYTVGANRFKKDTTSYNLLIKPIGKEIEGIETIYLVTDGAYNSINIEAFFNPVKNQYLIDYLHIKPLLSARSLVEDKASNLNTEKLTAVLIGNPDYELENFSIPNPDTVLLDPAISLLVRSYDSSKTISYLPGTEREIQGISTILKTYNWETDLYHLNSATEDNLKEVISPKVLHIATHGYFIDDASLSSSDDNFFGISSTYLQNNSLLKSGLLFAGAQNTVDGNTIPLNNNGILTAQEAMSLNLKGTELVVLSACETGKGDSVIGEGVYGLQRAFMLAGAKSVIMSFWNVNDETTQKLMTYFYTNWIEKGLTKYDAFRLAKLRLKDEFPEPYYWAPFVLLE